MKKKTITLITLLAMAAIMALPILAETIAFKTRSAEEEPYVYMEMGSNDPGDGASRFHDATGFIIYEFPCPAGSKYATLTWKIQAQYQVSVTNTDPDDDTAFEVIDQNAPTDEEVANGKVDWGYANGIQYPTYDLAKYCENNTTGKIWVKMADADTTNGWGGYIFGDYDVTYYVGTEPGAAVEKPKTSEEQSVDILAALNLTANDQAFVVGTTSEDKYFYKKDGNLDGRAARFMDGAAYVIYAFNVKASDTTAKITLGIDNQYDLRAANSDPDNVDAYTTIAVATPNDEETASGDAGWGDRYDENDQIASQTFDLSSLLTGKDGTIYVYVGDCQPENGWGGRIAFANGVLFSSYGSEGPAAGAATDAGTSTTSASTSTSSPSTFDAISIVAIVAFAALGTAVVTKKKH